MNQNRTLYDFLDDPYDAVMYGYKPCYLDCLSWVSSWLCKKSISHALSTTCDLLDCSLKEFPIELIKCLCVWLILLSIPFGGFFIIGTFSWFSLYTPKKLEVKVKRMWKHLDAQW